MESNMSLNSDPRQSSAEKKSSFKFCSQCGTMLNTDAMFCSNCGHRQQTANEPPRVSSLKACSLVDALGKKKIICIFVILAAVLLSIVLCITFCGKSSSGGSSGSGGSVSPERSTWEKTFESFNENVIGNLSDFPARCSYYPPEYIKALEKEYNTTVEELTPIVEEAVKHDRDLNNMVIGEHQLLDHEQVEKQELDELSKEYGLGTIREGVRLKAKYTYEFYGFTQTEEVERVLINIGGKWYFSPKGASIESWFDKYSRIDSDAH